MTFQHFHHTNAGGGGKWCGGGGEGVGGGGVGVGGGREGETQI